MGKHDDGLRYGEGTITDRPQPDGTTRYQARWREGTRKRAKTFATRDAAEDHLRQIARDRRDGRYLAPSELTVKQLMADWLERGAADWELSTVAAYRQRSQAHVVPALGALRVVTLTTPRLQHWVDELRRAGLAANTIDGVLRTIGGALNEAVQLGIIPQSPLRGVKRPSIQPATDPPTWTLEEVGRVLTQLTDDPRYNALYRVALATGLRPGELRGLKWSDVDLAAGRLTVRRTITRDAEARVILGTHSKTKLVHAVALPAPCVAALTTWQTAQKRERLAAPVWHDEGLVFTRADGRFLPLTSWQKRHERLIAAANVTYITPHQLRHTNATLDLAAGTHPKIVADRLGHRKIETTLNRYSHVSIDLQKAAADALAERLFGASEPEEDATIS